MGGNEIKEKGTVIIGMVMIFFLLILTNCQSDNEKTDIQKTDSGFVNMTKRNEYHYESTVLKEDCFICGDGEGTLLPTYWGDENVGIISLNSFDLAYIEINRYDDQGKLIEEPAQGSSTTITTSKNGFSFRVSKDVDRGYARCHLSFNEDEVLDLEQAAAHMCTDCINQALDNDWGGTPTGIAVVNFKTRELRLLRENLLAFQFDNFYISGRMIRNTANENFLEMDLLVFYCPRRYGD